jgi:hypothetical protein
MLVRLSIHPRCICWYVVVKAAPPSDESSPFASNQSVLDSRQVDWGSAINYPGLHQVTSSVLMELAKRKQGHTCFLLASSITLSN